MNHELLDHLDTLNDLAYECSCISEMERALKEYCEVQDLDPEGFDIVFQCGRPVVYIAE